MAYSQTSACSVKQSRFYDDLESASEGFFYKSCLVEQRENEREKQERKNARNVCNTFKQVLLCCFGNRQNGDVSSFSIMGYDINDIFDDATTVEASSEGTDTVIGYKRNDTLWAIEPSKRFKYLDLNVFEGKWLLLAWASRIVKGENLNKSLLNSIINECKLKSQKINSITPNVIKNFPNLNLSEDVYEMESNDLMVGLDNLMVTLQDYVQLDKNTFVFIVQRESLYGIYYTHQGTVDYTVLFEIKLFEKGEISYFARLLAFESFERVKEYLLSTRNLQNHSKLYFYFFNFQKLSVDWNTDVQQNDLEEVKDLVEKQSSDPKYDVKKLIKVLKSAQNV